MIQLGIALLTAGDIEAAEAQFKKALRINPDHYDALHSLGLIALHKQNFPAAVESSH